MGNTTAITAGDTSGTITQVETRGYDAWDHVITDTVGGAPGSNAPALTTLTAYDLDGNVAQVEQPQGNTTYNTYDLTDQVTEELLYPHPVGAPGPNDAAYSAYSYDGAGNVTLSIDADNRSTTTTLDGDNRTLGDTSVSGDGTTVITTTLGYDPDGNTLRQILQPDPSQQDGARTYVYVGDDPIDEADGAGTGGLCDVSLFGGRGLRCRLAGARRLQPDRRRRHRYTHEQ